MSSYVTAFPMLLEENFDAPSLLGPRIRTMICTDILHLIQGWDVDVNDLFVVVRQRGHTSQISLFKVGNPERLDYVRSNWIHFGRDNGQYIFRSENMFRYLTRATPDLWVGSFDTPQFWERQGMEVIYGSEFAIGEFSFDPGHMFAERLN